MDQFPAMMYRYPAVLRDALALQDGKYDSCIVADEVAQDVALADGWQLTPADAKAASEATKEPVAPADDAPPTRAEMEAKAAELGLKFDGRTGDKKLADMIAAKLAA